MHYHGLTPTLPNPSTLTSQTHTPQRPSPSPIPIPYTLPSKTHDKVAVQPPQTKGSRLRHEALFVMDQRPTRSAADAAGDQALWPPIQAQHKSGNAARSGTLDVMRRARGVRLMDWSRFVTRKVRLVSGVQSNTMSGGGGRHVREKGRSDMGGIVCIARILVTVHGGGGIVRMLLSVMVYPCPSRPIPSHLISFPIIIKLFFSELFLVPTARQSREKRENKASSSIPTGSAK
ncbi:hypothetical protein BS50DRAFT_367095 [Corynespora cassiicola Philippines]|uniref:Uncharacterized protein n=1 Tax=Corynespora cassiicola Philippines TaxID=1448308 RepID=A0A2T2NSU4_CORCC|nr:hypothetical protein BS50DRAFT_367095 [Corynespora cassiicola Philippines]